MALARCLWRLHGKAVARSPDGFNVVFVSAGFEGLAQAPDMYVDGALFDKDVVAPDLVKQLRPRKHTFGVRHEKVQQAEFGGADRQ